MFTRRRQRKVPRGGHQPPLQFLIDQAEIRLAGVGVTREPSGPWIAAADLWLKLQSKLSPAGPRGDAAGRGDRAADHPGSPLSLGD